MTTQLFKRAFAAMVILGSAGLMVAQTARTPGQIAPLPEFTAGVIRTDVASVKDARHDRNLNHLWIASMVAMAAASGADAATSWGKVEGNGLLASQDGRFGAKGISIKMGIAAGVIIPQILFRRHKDLRMAFSLGNFAQAALFSGIAVHNLGIAAPK